MCGRKGNQRRHLQGNPAGYDIAIAADVLVYIGDLQPLFAAAHGAIRANGWLAVSIEGHIGEGFALRASRRYTHSTDCVHGVAAAVGFEIEGTVSTTIRREADTPVRGTVVLLRRLPTSARLRNADV